MSRTVRDAPKRPSGNRVLALGLLMSASASFQLTAFLQVSLTPSWLLPVLAAWLAQRHGIAVLRDAWPLVILPTLGVNFDHGIGFSFGVPSATLLLALIVAAAADARLRLPPLEHWLRGDTVWPAASALCLLVVSALEAGSWRVGTWRLDLLALPGVLVMLAAIRWEAVAAAAWPTAPRRYAGAFGLLVAAIGLAGLVLSGAIVLGPRQLRVGSYSPAPFLAILCFGLVVLGFARARNVAGLLLAGLVLDRLLALGDMPASFAMETEWRLLDWGALFASLAATLAGQVLRPFFADGAFMPTSVRPVLHLLLAWLALLLCPLLLTGFGVSSGTAGLWLVAALAFAAGTYSRERSLVFVPPLLMVLWLLAALFDPAGGPGRATGMLATLGTLGFTFALCGAFLAHSRALAALGATHAASPAQAEAIERVDLSPLAAVVEQVDRSATWRSFLVAAAPFVVAWQLFELYGFRIVVGDISEAFGEPPMLEDWHYAVAAMLALAPFAFAFWDWLDRQDRYRLLALASASIAGAIAWQLFGALLGAGVRELFGDFGDTPLEAGGILAFSVLLLGSGLLAGTDRRVAHPLFLALCTLTGVAVVSALAWALGEGTVEAQELPRLLAEPVVILLICVALARFIRLRLLLAGDRPREWLFGALRDKGFWVRMAAAAGLPSSSWRLGALSAPAFWALFAARFVVYTGGVLARSWAAIGAVVILFGHLLFHAGKRLSAREMWRPRTPAAADRPILFLRGFDDDQCSYRRRPWQLLARWLDLWSFRQNLDEAMVDELAQFGPVVALGRPGDTRTPFGAQRHYSADADWQQTLADAARSAQAIVLVASDSPGVQWEYALLKNEAMLDKVLLMFRPDGEHTAANRHAAEWMCPGGGGAVDAAIAAGLQPVSLRLIQGRPILAASRAANAAAGVLALRLHFERA